MASKPQNFELTASYATIENGQTPFMVFVMSAEALARLACPRRYLEDPVSGVQRELDRGHVSDIVRAMVAGEPIPGEFVLNLTGEWVSLGGQLLGVEGESSVEVLDGQHRAAACRDLLQAGRVDILTRYSFSVRALKRASDEMRRQLFLAQAAAKPISGHHQTAIALAANRFNNDRRALAARMAAELNLVGPYKGRLHFGEPLRGPRNRPTLPEGKVMTVHSAASALWVLVGKSALLGGFAPEQQVQFVVDLMSAVHEVYPLQFEDGRFLATTFGFGVVCLLPAVAEGTFREELKPIVRSGAVPSKEEMKRLFLLLPRFQWKPREISVVKGTRATSNTNEVVRRFNRQLAEAIGRSKKLDDHPAESTGEENT